MSRHDARDDLVRREIEVNSLIAGTPGGSDAASLRLEKTVIIAAKAIIEAIWMARY